MKPAPPLHCRWHYMDNLSYMMGAACACARPRLPGSAQAPLRTDQSPCVIFCRTLPKVDGIGAGVRTFDRPNLIGFTIPSLHSSADYCPKLME